MSTRSIIRRIWLDPFPLFSLPGGQAHPRGLTDGRNRTRDGSNSTGPGVRGSAIPPNSYFMPRRNYLRGNFLVVQINGRCTTVSIKPIRFSFILRTRLLAIVLKSGPKRKWNPKGSALPNFCIFSATARNQIFPSSVVSRQLTT